MLSPMPVIQLKSGLLVANFSSPRPFLFDTGEILPACGDLRANELLLDSEESVVVPDRLQRVPFTTISLNFKMSGVVEMALEEAIDKWVIGEFDVCLVPLPVMQVIHAHARKVYVVNRSPAKMPFRCIRVADRITKAICHDKFCL